MSPQSTVSAPAPTAKRQNPQGPGLLDQIKAARSAQEIDQLLATSRTYTGAHHNTKTKWQIWANARKMELEAEAKAAAAKAAPAKKQHPSAARTART